jgi:beta-ribofuranosylaminobenzene 5'-phosphate synthase
MAPPNGTGSIVPNPIESPISRLVSSVIVTAFPRIHFGLLDLSHATPRKYGGAGVMLDWPTTVVAARPSSHDEIFGLDALDLSAQDDLLQVLSRLRKEHGAPSLHLEISHTAPQHIGLGSKTALILATIGAVARACQIEISPQNIQRLSGRGGVSGIGLHGFFQGGLLVDGGHVQDSGPHTPSRGAHPERVPLLVLRASLDCAWQFFLVLPKGRMYSDGAEIELFRTYAPIPRADSLSALALMYHGVLPAFLTNDLPLLRKSLQSFRQTGFKRREVESQTRATSHALEALDTINGCAVGMSSVGPLLFAITNLPLDEIEPAIRAVCIQTDAELLAICPARNEGHVVKQIQSNA